METIYCENRNGATQETLFQDRVRPKVPSHDTRSLGLGRSPPGPFIIIIGSVAVAFSISEMSFFKCGDGKSQANITETASPSCTRPLRL